MITLSETPAIETVEICRTYDGPDGPIHALKGVNLVVPVGHMVAVKGRSGSGKTTLLNIIGGLDHPTSGEVRVFGERVDRMGPGAAARWRAENLGFVFQTHGLMPTMSAFENVELAVRLAGKKRKERTTLATEHLDRVGLASRMNHRPTELSGGQRQRAAVARALASGNKLIIADEPTAGLDTATSTEVFQLLRSLVHDSGITILMATHDPVADDFMDTTSHLELGSLVIEKLTPRS